MPLISDIYRRQNRQMHDESVEFGTSTPFDQHAEAIVTMAQRAGARTLLDYGCGKGFLKPAIRRLMPSLAVREYDPGIEGKHRPPKPADMVVAFDVMEHIEPEYLPAVLKHIGELTLKCAYITIHHGAALKLLPDGRNAHLIQESQQWWADKLATVLDVKAMDTMETAPDGAPFRSVYLLFPKH
jgi:hypothetical protein